MNLPITIAKSEHGGFDVIVEDRHAKGLTWAELLGQIALMTAPINRAPILFRMTTDAEDQAEELRRTERNKSES